MTTVDERSALTAEMVVDGRVVLSPALSPDGRWVAYVLGSVGQADEYPTTELWLAAVDGSAAPRKLTGDAHDTSPKWTSDSRSVSFLSDRIERGTAQLHRVRLSGEVESLTRWRGGLSDHVPLAEPDLTGVIAPDEGRVDRLWLLDRRGMSPLGDFRGRHVVEAVQRPAGGPLAVLTWSVPDLDPGLQQPELHLLDPADGTVRDLGPAVAEASALTWWRPDTDWHLAYLAKTPPSLVGGLAVFDLPVTETVEEHRNLTAGMARCPSELVAAGQPLIVFADGLDTTIHRLDARFPETLRVRGRVESVTASGNGDVIAAVVSTSNEPANVCAGSPHGPLHPLSDTRPELRGIDWGVQERLSYLAWDGLRLDGLLVLPVGKSRVDGPFPLVTLVHGGPYGRHADSLMVNWFPPGQWLATAGYAVFLPNPRGGQGHGHDFAASVAGAVGLDEWTDILAGIDLLVAEGVADPDRLGIGGWSHGGFLAAWAVGQTTRFKAALVGAGISDWGMLAATGEYGSAEAALGGSTGWEGTGPHPHDRLSPISFAARIRTPVLIVHGADDTNVPVSQAEFLHRALRHFGVEHEYVVYPRENHPIRERDHQLDLLRRTRTWFDRWLRSAPPA
jgi:dipeptidyl aminopeptidase/acylaminoacyl peptidase